MPLNLVYAGVTGKLLEHLKKNNCDNWHVQIKQKTYLEAEYVTSVGE